MPATPKIELSERIKALNIVKDFLETGIDELAKTVPWSITPKRIKSDKTVTVAGLELAKVAGIPLNVTLVIEAITKKVTDVYDSLPEDGSARSLFTRGSLAGIVTVMLKYYHNPEWSLNDTMEQLNEANVNDLWAFLEAQRSGQELDDVEAEEEAEGKESQ